MRNIENLLVHLFTLGAVEVDIERGFELQEHRCGSERPRPPIFFNLRNADNPRKPGKLTEPDFALIAGVLLQHLRLNNVQFDAIAAIPNAGDPIGRALQQLLIQQERSATPFIPLKKHNGDIVIDGDVSRKMHSGAEVLLLDDVVSGAGSKIKPAALLRDAGFSVSRCCVLIDNEQGGSEILAQMGIEVLAPITRRIAARIGFEHNFLDIAVLEAIDAFYANIAA